MNNVSNNKTLIAIIVFLVLTNIVVLCYFVCWNKACGYNKPKEGTGFTAALQNEVGFTPEQMKAFNTIKETHWATARTGMEDIRRIKMRLFEMAKIPAVPDTTLQKLTDSIGIWQREVEWQIVKHFKAMRSICTPEQLPKLDSLLKKFIAKPRKSAKGESGDTAGHHH